VKKKRGRSRLHVKKEKKERAKKLKSKPEI